MMKFNFSIIFFRVRVFLGQILLLLFFKKIIAHDQMWLKANRGQI